MSETQGLRRLLSPKSWFGGRNRATAAEKKAMVHGGGTGSEVLFFNETRLPGTNRDYAAEVGDGLGSSVLAGPLNFLMRTFPEAPPMVERRNAQGEWESDDDHELVKLLDNPNPYYSGEALLMAMALDFAFGNAYWYKVRNVIGDVVQLWWIPRQLIQPRWRQDGTTFIDYYQYTPGGQQFALPVRDVVHFRFGVDPRNTRLGLSQLGALMRDVAVDDTAANFIASVHKNMGVIGVVISPKAGTANKSAIEETKAYIKAHFTGDERGGALALGAPTDVNVMQYNLQGFDVSPVRDVSEERVCAALGLPAAVVGFGTGLQQTKVGATMKEMRQLAWTGGIIPIQRIIAKEIARSLLVEFESGRRQKARFVFDVSKVRALWEDNNEKHMRVREDFKANLIDRATALREVGRPVNTDDEGVYFSDTQPKATPAKPGANDDVIPPAVAARNGALNGSHAEDTE